MNTDQILHLVQVIIAILAYIDNRHEKMATPYVNKEQPDNLK